MQGSSGSTGYVVLMLGAILFGVGVAISFTGIGACLGIPMVLIALPMIVFGAINRSRARSAHVDEIVRQSVSSTVARAMPPVAVGVPVGYLGICGRCSGTAKVEGGLCEQCSNDAREAMKP